MRLADSVCVSNNKVYQCARVRARTHTHKHTHTQTHTHTNTHTNTHTHTHTQLVSLFYHNVLNVWCSVDVADGH